MRQTARTAAELLGWWLLLAGLWLVLISTPDALELLVGAVCSLPAAVAAVAAHRVVGGR